MLVAGLALLMVVILVMVIALGTIAVAVGLILLGSVAAFYLGGVLGAWVFNDRFAAILGGLAAVTVFWICIAAYGGKGKPSQRKPEEN